MQFSQSRLFSRSPLFNDVIKKYFTSAQMYFCVFNASVLFYIFAKSHGCTISLPWSWMRVRNVFIRSRKNDVQKYSQMETHITVISITAFWPVWACCLIMTHVLVFDACFIFKDREKLIEKIFMTVYLTFTDTFNSPFFL